MRWCRHWLVQAIGATGKRDFGSLWWASSLSWFTIICICLVSMASMLWGGAGGCQETRAGLGRTIIALLEVAIAVVGRATALQASGGLLCHGLRRTYEDTWQHELAGAIQTRRDAAADVTGAQGCGGVATSRDRARWGCATAGQTEWRADGGRGKLTCRIEGRRINGAGRVHDAVANATI